MKEKLNKIRDVLKYQENMAINGTASHRDCIAGSCATALTLLDSILADLESLELMSAVVTAIANTALNYSKKNDGKCLSAADFSYAVAQAAIDTIKGE